GIPDRRATLPVGSTGKLGFRAAPAHGDSTYARTDTEVELEPLGGALPDGRAPYLQIFLGPFLRQAFEQQSAFTVQVAPDGKHAGSVVVVLLVEVVVVVVVVAGAVVVVGAAVVVVVVGVVVVVVDTAAVVVVVAGVVAVCAG